MTNHNPLNNEQYSQRQTVGDVQVKGSNNVLNILQGEVVNLSIYDRIPQGLINQLPVKVARPLIQQEYRQRQVLLNKIREFWIKGVLDTSLHARVLLELQLEQRPDAVKRPFDGVAEFSEIETHPLPTRTNVSTVFNQMGEGRTLLILGEPGSGKTITLLKLAQDLILRSEEDLNRPMPVVFNLSSWANKRQPIAKWLVQELYEKYQVSRSLGKIWVDEQQLILLLDGLDEVKSEYQNDCIHALNQFIQVYGLTEIAISCRIQDYQALSNQLKLRSAVCIQPLTSEQIEQYLEHAGDKLAAFKAVVQQDTQLKSLAASPLMLSIMSLTYQGCSLENFPKPSVVTERYQQLFNAYIDRMFQRRGTAQRYSRSQTQKWLTWLAQQMTYTSQSIFFIEGIQVDWLPTKTSKLLYTLVSGLSGGMTGAITVGLLIWLSGELNTREFNNASLLLLLGITFGVYGGVTRDAKAEIKTVETLQWSWRNSKQYYRSGLILGLGLLLILLIASILSFCFRNSLIHGIIPLLAVLLSAILINELTTELIGWLRGPEIQRKSVPNQGIYRSVRNAIILSLAFGSMSGLICWLISGLPGIIIGLCIGISAGMSGGARAAGQHSNLRFILYHTGYSPWNYRHFLDYAVDRLFLQKVGGGYIFVHRSLLEHFAQMNPTQIGLPLDK